MTRPQSRLEEPGGATATDSAPIVTRQCRTGGAGAVAQRAAGHTERLPWLNKAKRRRRKASQSGLAETTKDQQGVRHWAVGRPATVTWGRWVMSSGFWSGDSSDEQANHVAAHGHAEHEAIYTLAMGMMNMEGVRGDGMWGVGYNEETRNYELVDI